MKVIQLISASNLYGAERVMLLLARYLKENSIDISIGIINNFDKGNEVETAAKTAGIEVMRFKAVSRYDKACIKDIGRAIARGGFDIVHSHNYKSDFYTVAAGIDKRTAWIATAHTWGGTTFATQCYDLLDMLIIRRARKVVVVSSAVYRQARRALIPKKKLSTIFNGIDTAPFAQAAGQLNNNKDFVVLVCGRLEREKRPLWAIDIFNRFAQNIPAGARLAFAGAGSMEQAAREYANACGIADRVEFLGKLGYDGIAAVYAKADAVLLPSSAEGMPMVALEAMAAGRPVVMAEPFFRDIDPKGEASFAARIGEKDDYVRALMDIYALKQRGGYVEFSKRISHLVAERFDYKVMGSKYLNLYQRYAGGG